MLTGSRKLLVRTLGVLVTTGMIVLLPGATLANARGSRGNPPKTDSATVESKGPKIVVKVSGSGYKAGKGGSPGAGGGGGGLVSRTVPLPCWMSAVATGKGYYDQVTSGNKAPDILKSGIDARPYPGYEKHKDDDKGHWYRPDCNMSNWPDQTDAWGFFIFVVKYVTAHPVAYFPANQEPVAQVPPEVLREIATNSLTLPDPELDWNPKRAGNQGTLVNLDTWFWLDNAPATLQVRAAAGGNEAIVTATFGGMDITAPGEEPLSCAGSGTAWTSGADSTCVLAFSRASSALGGQATPVTVRTRWTATWTLNDADQGPVTPQPTPVTALENIRVDEVQTLVKSAQ